MRTQAPHAGWGVDKFKHKFKLIFPRAICMHRYRSVRARARGRSRRQKASRWVSECTRGSLGAQKGGLGGLRGRAHVQPSNAYAYAYGRRVRERVNALPYVYRTTARRASRARTRRPRRPARTTQCGRNSDNRFSRYSDTSCRARARTRVLARECTIVRGRVRQHMYMHTYTHICIQYTIAIVL